MGAVENIGIKTTRIRSLSGEQLIFSNADLLGSRIRNYGRMAERTAYSCRIRDVVYVVHTQKKQISEMIPDIIRDAIEAQDKTRFGRFPSAGAAASARGRGYMDIHQAITLQIYDRFDDESIDFAFPTRTVILEGADQTQAA